MGLAVSRAGFFKGVKSWLTKTKREFESWPYPPQENTKTTKTRPPVTAGGKRAKLAEEPKKNLGQMIKKGWRKHAVEPWRTWPYPPESKGAERAKRSIN